MNFPRLADMLSVSSPKFLIAAILAVVLCLVTGCAGKIVKETEAKPSPPPKPPASIPMWLGSPSRNNFGTGPVSDKPLQIVWQFQTQFIKGRLHEDPWGGSSWPGQPSVDDKYVYFGSADGNLYCLDIHDGRVIWSFKAEDSLKATPVIAGDRIIASGLDHYIYCVDRKSGNLRQDLRLIAALQ